MWNSIGARMAVLRIWSDSGGEDLIEYSMGAGLVALAVVAAMPSLRPAVSDVFGKIGSLLASAVN